MLNQLSIVGYPVNTQHANKDNMFASSILSDISYCKQFGDISNKGPSSLPCKAMAHCPSG